MQFCAIQETDLILVWQMRNPKGWRNISEVASDLNLGIQADFFFNRLRREKDTLSRENGMAEGKEKGLRRCQDIWCI